MLVHLAHELLYFKRYFPSYFVIDSILLSFLHFIIMRSLVHSIIEFAILLHWLMHLILDFIMDPVIHSPIDLHLAILQLHLIMSRHAPIIHFNSMLAMAIIADLWFIPLRYLFVHLFPLGLPLHWFIPISISD